MKIHTRVAIGLLAGVLVGAIFGPSAAVLEPLGTLFIRLIRMLIVPLVASSLIMAITSLPGRGALGRMGVRAFGFILVSLAVALIIAIGCGLLLQPGAGLSAEARDALLQSHSGAVPEVDPDAPRATFVQTLIELVPENIFSAAAQGNVLQILFVSVLIGLATSALPEAARAPLVELATATAHVMFKLVGWILELAPFVVFGIMAAVVGRSGLSVLWTLGYYVVVVAAALVLQVVLVYGFVLKALARQSILRFARTIRSPLLITFATCSTSAALPVSLSVMQTGMGLSNRVTSFVVPLGAAMGRDGSAMYQAISVLFIAQVYGKSLSGGELVTLLVAAMLSSLAVASVPSASFINVTILLSALGLPVEGAALVFGVERPLDMLRSSTNIIGQLTNTTYVGAAEGEIEESDGV